jgi:transglutaminase-like putative cysteine protease
VEDLHPPADLSPSRAGLRQEIARYWSVEPDSPHHFLAASPRVQLVPAITEYAEQVTADMPSTMTAALALCMAIHRNFTYDPKATDVETKPARTSPM